MTPASARRWTLVAGPQYRAPDLSGIDGVVAAPQDLSLLRTTYHDTPDLRVLRWGAELRHDAGSGWTLVLGDGERGAQHVTLVHRFADTPGVPHEALDLLSAFTRRTQLRPVLRTRTERTETDLIDTGGETVGHLRDDQVTVLQGRRIATRFRELELVAEPHDGGDGSAMEAIGMALRGAGAAPAAASATAVRAIGAAAAAPPDVTAPAASPHASAAQAVRRAIAQSVSRLIVHDAAVREGSDPEGVHQARVATRRLRSDLRTFAPLLDAEWVSRLRDELHGLADLLGEVRDADVLLDRLRAATGGLPASDSAAALPILRALERARDAAREQLLQAMRSDAYVRLLDDLVAAASHPPTTPEASADAASLLPPLARKPWRRLRRTIKGLPPQPSDSELHMVRILAKRARYATEAVAPVSKPSVGEFAGAIARVQEVLGDHHDAVVAEQWLRGLGAGEEAEPVPPLVMGELIGLERATAAARRDAWPTVWKGARKAHPKSWT